MDMKEMAKLSDTNLKGSFGAKGRRGSNGRIARSTEIPNTSSDSVKPEFSAPEVRR